jgi:hypothetical protein
MNGLIWGSLVAFGCLARAQVREHGVGQTQFHQVTNREITVLHDKRAL